MSIQVGDKLPSVTLKHLTSEGLKEITTDDVFKGKKVVMFGVPGAFTPGCSKTHLPGYVAKAGDIKHKGVDDIVCLAVNDPFAMAAWSEHQGAGGKVTMLPDGNGALTRALGLDVDLSAAGLGTRCKRFSLVAEDGVVTSLNVEDKPSDITVSSAESCLASFD